MQKIATYSRGWVFAAAWALVGTAGCTLSETGTVTPSGGSGGSGGDASSSSSSGGGAGGIGGGAAGGTGGSAGSTTSSSSSSSGLPGAEDCADGTDNDGDALVDCADSDCVSLFSCNKPPPKNWGYVRIRQTAFEGAMEPCAGGQAPQRLYEGADTGECNKCSCLAPGDCEVTMTCYSNESCGGGTTATTYTTDAGGCTADSIAAGGGSCRLTDIGTVPGNAGCQSNGGGLTNQNPYSGEVHVCPADSNGAGCGAEVCVLQPSGTYENRLCIARTDVHNCPAGFPEQHLTFATYADTRACSACACDAGDISCVGNTTITLWTDAMCTTGAQTVSSNDTCVNIPGGLMSSNVTSIASMTVTNCPAPTPSGAVTGQNPTTVCCALP